VAVGVGVAGSGSKAVRVNTCFIFADGNLSKAGMGSVIHGRKISPPEKLHASMTRENNTATNNTTRPVGWFLNTLS
jgi:hypothetical protein